MNIIMPRLTRENDDITLKIEDELEGWKWNFQDLTIQNQDKKLLLIGESVAAGYFYRPQLTFADILQVHFTDYKVIDCSRINFPFTQIQNFKSLVEQLKPEKIVFFVGNNFTLRGSSEDIFREIESQLLWIKDFQHTIDICFLIPCFNWKEWTPKEILCKEKQNYQLVKQALKEKKGLEKITHLKDFDCPTVQYLLGNYQASYDFSLGYEAYTPRISPLVKENLTTFCHKNGLRFIDTEQVAHHLVDYCHFSFEGLKAIASLYSLRFPNIELTPDIEIISTARILFHCYGLGQYDLSDKNLEKLKTLMTLDAFENYIVYLSQVLLTEGTLSFSKFFLESLPDCAKVHSHFQFHYPPLDFFNKWLERTAIDNRILTTETRIDLLKSRNWFSGQGHPHLDKTFRPYLQYRSFEPLFTSYFPQTNQRERILKVLIDFPDKISSSAQGIEIILNGHLVESFAASDLATVKSIPLKNFNVYNQLEIFVTFEHELPKEQYLPHGLFRIHVCEIH